MQQTIMCPNCGSQNAAGQQFCTNCGTKLASGGQQQAWQTQPTPGAPPTARGASGVDTMQQAAICPNCGSQNAPGQQFCTNCGTKLGRGGQQAATLTEKEAALHEKTQRYVLLGATAIIFRIMGWVVLVGGILGSIGVGVMAAQGASKKLVSLLDQGLGLIGVSGVAGAGLAVMVFGSIIGSLLCGLGLLALAELCKAVIVIDENTRFQD